MSEPVARTVTRKFSDGTQEKYTLESCRDLPAYVLLGDSGAGKTTAFEQEAKASDGEYITARNFNFKEKKDKTKETLFIDALDEMRAGGEDPRKPIDKIRDYLKNTQAPFRLSCRAADWLGENDSKALQYILPPETELTVLYLDPLTEGDIKTILMKEGVSNPDEFINTAHQHNLSALLSNPQILKLLIKAINNKWPKNRKEIYDMACLQLVSEENNEHRHAKPRDSRLPTEIILNAAGYLCAIQLLSGIAGFSQDQGQASAQYFELTALSTPLPLLSSLDEALKSNIFHSAGEERRTPIHRSVAEYLGAKYIADLVQAKTDPLPFERVLALMPDAMGAISSDLRGLCAWLAVHCNGNDRSMLIQRDPLGVIIYGDIRAFTNTEKIFALKVLKSKLKNMDWPNFYDASFGALGTADMIARFQEILSSSSREAADQKLLVIVLSAIAYGEPMPNLIRSIENIIRDPSYLGSVRSYAIEVLKQHDAKNTLLLQLLEDIHKGIIEDRDDEVLGALLNKLYPDMITPEEIWHYVHAPNIHILNDYSHFLHDKLAKSQDKDLPILLDGLVKKPELIPHLSSLIGRLLAKGIETWGDKITTKNLYEWLNLGIDRWERPAIQEEQAKTISDWLTKHPKQYQAIIEYITELCAQRGDHFDFWEFSKYFLRLQNASYPNGMTEWYLNKAKLEYPMRRPVSQYYLKYAVSSMTDNQKPTLDQVACFHHHLKEYPDLLNMLEAMLQPPAIPPSQPENTILKQEYQREKSERADNFRKYLAKIQEGTAPPGIMHDLAKSYKGLFSNIYGDTPDARLRNLLDNNEALVSAAYHGLKEVVYRKDLPTIKEIIDTARQGKFHQIRLPSLISISILYQDAPASILKLNDDVLASLLTFRFSEPQCCDEVEWVVNLIHERPMLIEQVLINYASAMLKEEKEDIKYLCIQMIYGKYAKLAPTVLGPLLKAFPSQASQKFSQNVLNLILKGAIEHLDKTALKAIIQDRLKNSTMDAIQKVYWLAAGFVIDPATYTAALREHIAKKQTYKEDLKNFIQSHWQNRNPFADLTEQAVSFLIELLAPECSPERPLGTYRSTPDMQTADLVYSLIHELQYNSSKTTSELQRLMTLESISHWRSILEQALYAKQVAESRASFKYLTAKEVSKTLQNGTPQNAADLSAITMFLLREISNNIRHASTNDYRSYWTRDPKGKPQQPLHENPCRDVLLSHLNPELKRYGVEGHKEGSYAEDTRADIKVSFAGHYNIPIEIKKESHADLWTAIHEQLITKYVRDPGTAGHGIYLVFWFGHKLTPIDPKGGGKPRSARELKDRLEESLTKEQKDYIQILVIDCSLP